MTIFDSDVHMSCPKCGFEVLYVDHEDRVNYYVFHWRTLDVESEQRDYSEMAKKDCGKIVCNHVDCDWSEYF